MNKIVAVACMLAVVVLAGCGFKITTPSEAEVEVDRLDASLHANVRHRHLASSDLVATGVSIEKARIFIGLPQIVDYHNGVFYFPFVEADYGNALSAFRKNNPHLEFVSAHPNIVRMVGESSRRGQKFLNGQADYGGAIGHWVFFREKEK